MGVGRQCDINYASTLLWKNHKYGYAELLLFESLSGKSRFVLEFKVHDPDEEKTFQETVESALKQIEEKAYDAVLIDAGINKKQIRHYGFAFEGKKVLIGSDKIERSK